MSKQFDENYLKTFGGWVGDYFVSFNHTTNRWMAGHRKLQVEGHGDTVEEAIGNAESLIGS